MKALVTGANGFAGSHLVEYLLSQGDEVVAVTRPGDPVETLAAVLSRVRVEPADLMDAARLKQVVGQSQPDRIYHLAAFSSVEDSARSPARALEVNVVGTANLIAAWRELAFSSRLLCVSSSQVYGRVEKQEELPLRETSALRPSTPYAASKVAMEFWALQWAESERLPIIVVRPFNHTGPRQAPSYVCSSLARQAAEIDLGLRRPLMEVGNLDVARDFSDVRDVVRAYRLLLEAGKSGEVYQVSSGRAVSIGEIVGAFRRFVRQPFEVRVEQARVRTGQPAAIWGDPSKTRAATGWKPEYDFAQTLADLKAYWSERLRAECCAKDHLIPSA